MLLESLLNLGFMKILTSKTKIIDKIGIGCWQIGGHHQISGIQNGWEPISKRDRIKLIEKEIDLGFSFFDTAAGYGDGISEDILGTGIRNSKKRDKIKVCTKIKSFQLTSSSEQNWDNFEKIINKSIKRLKIDFIDTLLLHSPKANEIKDDFLELFIKAKQKGLVKHYGISASCFDELKLSIQRKFGDFFQWNFSILDTRINKYLSKQKFKKEQIFVARSLLFRGLITENFLKNGPDFRYNDARSQISKNILVWVHKNLKKIQDLSSSIGLTISEFAILYGVTNSNCNLNLIGIRNFENLKSIEKLLMLSNKEIYNAYKLALTFKPSTFKYN